MKDSHRQSSKLIFGIMIGIAIIILLGIGLGIWYNQLTENNPQRDRSSCEQSGGEWLENQATCLISNRIAGEDCIDGGQCQSGVCFPPDLTQEQQVALSSGSIAGVRGTCYPEELVEGCVKQIINGTVSLKSLCIE